MLNERLTARAEIVMRAALTFIGLSALSTLAFAQDSAADSVSSPKLTCVIPVAPADSSNEIVYLRLAPVDDLRSAPRSPLTKERRTQHALLLQEIRGFVEIPRPLSLPIGIATGFIDSPSDRGGGRVVPDLESTVAFTLHSHGGVSEIAVEVPARLPQLDSALRSALERAGAAGVLSGLLGVSGPKPERMPLYSARFRLGITLSERGASVRAPFFRARLPRYTLTTAAADPNNEPPRYPKRAREMQLDGRVLLKFVIDTAGRIEPETVDVLEASYLDFITVIFDELPRWRYQSSTVNGCPVPQLVQQRFVFEFQERSKQRNHDVRPWLPPVIW